MHASDSEAAILCNLDALTAAERERRSQLARELQLHALSLRESEAGYRVELPNDPAVCERALELILLERRCCPFLALELAFAPGEGSVELAIGGAPGVKQFLRETGVLGSTPAAGPPTCC
jgi:hypothetical protein